jgi:hypothetical protein
LHFGLLSTGWLCCAKRVFSQRSSQQPASTSAFRCGSTLL